MKTELKYIILSCIENLTVNPYRLETIEEATEEAKVIKQMLTGTRTDIEPTPENVMHIWNEIIDVGGV